MSDPRRNQKLTDQSTTTGIMLRRSHRFNQRIWPTPRRNASEWTASIFQEKFDSSNCSLLMYLNLFSRFGHEQTSIRIQAVPLDLKDITSYPYGSDVN